LSNHRNDCQNHRNDRQIIEMIVKSYTVNINNCKNILYQLLSYFKNSYYYYIYCCFLFNFWSSLSCIL